MIRNITANHYRAAATFVAAAVLSFNLHHHASAQQTVDLFGGTLATPTTLTLGGVNPNTTVNTPTNFGPGYSGTLSFTASAVNSLSEGFAATADASNALTITQTGVATALGITSASKTFTAVLSPGATYALTLTRTTGFTAGLLGSANISLSEGGTAFVNTASGQGLAGAVDLLGLFGTNNGVASFQFTVPATLPAGALGVTISTSLPVSALGGSYTFQSASITQVPEPGSVTAALLGTGGLMALRFRRRLRAL